MNRIFAIWVITVFAGRADGQTFPLSAPRISSTSVFFRHSSRVEMDLGMSGVKIHYTTNGKEPGPTDPLYRRPFRIRRDMRLSARAFHPDFLPSATSITPVYRVKRPFRKGWKVEPEADIRYGGNLPATRVLTNQQPGMDNLDDGSWLGFRQTFHVTGVSSRRTRFLCVHYRESPESWILAPAEIVARQTDSGLITGICTPAAGGGTGCCCLPVLPSTPICLTIQSAGLLPSGHPGAGQPAWLFVDEIFGQ